MKVGLLDSLNAYLILGERSLLIDTGYDKEEIAGILNDSLCELGTSLERTDIFLTHLHPDHAELATRFAAEGKQIMLGAYEADILNGKRPRPEAGTEGLRRLGFSDEFVEAFFRMVNKKRAPDGQNRFIGLNEGNTLEYGGHKLRCVGISGHSPGQMGLYIAEKKMFFSGDHILYGVTPSVSAWNDEPNPLKLYIKNLEKLKSMEIETILPGHRSQTCPVNQRIEQIIARHHKKIEETLSLMKDSGARSPFEIASVITWNTHWEKLSTFQQFSAVSEVAVKLEYLLSQGLVEKSLINGVGFFSAK
jgi:glyoxylase-like metal-dependent hydrolase (beta-lactamase superfamily II)